MRRIDLLFAAMLIGVVFVALYCTDPRRNLIRNDDAKVIEASLLSFYEKTDWNDWNEGDLIQVDPKFSRRDLTFSEGLLEVVRGMAQEKHRSTEDVKKLRLMHPGDAANPKERPPLIKLDMDDRIAFAKLRSWLELPPPKPAPLKNRHGIPGSARVKCYVSAPAYSKDGQAAVLQVDIPMGLHGAHFTFVLQKKGDEWQVAFVKQFYYV